MSREIIIKPSAEYDLKNGFGWIGQDSIEAALNFLAAAKQTFDEIAEMPGMGKRRETKNPKMVGLRQMPVRGFEKYLVFYQVTEEAVQIVRVIHGYRDIDALLNEDEY